MPNVNITRRQERFSRTVNGAWSRHTTTEIERMERDESFLTPKLSLGSGITVTWPDGVIEHAFPGNRGVGNYPPVCIPDNGRLAALLLEVKS